MKAVALIALALTLGYSQCVAACNTESSHLPPTTPAGHCHQHPDSGDPPRSPELCGQNSAAELYNVATTVFPVRFL